ncbi:hypothetical protein [Aquisalimonas sp.]|uniref:hypothetical protein n=1 Tax=Aquisalimonas sp. TaxID=1872621 RepID=UPI0025C0BF7F|nr:hypothetical protein [Aquisalimonas sp.]
MPANGAQSGELFDEANLEALIGELEAEVAQAAAPEPPAQAKLSRPDADHAKPKCHPLRAHLKRVRGTIDLAVEDAASLGD